MSVRCKATPKSRLPVVLSLTADFVDGDASDSFPGVKFFYLFNYYRNIPIIVRREND